MDVKTAFLNGDIEETIYMTQTKTLCRKMQRIWFVSYRNSFMGSSKLLISGTLSSIRLLSLMVLRQILWMSVYHEFCGIRHIFLVLYVDDILLATNDVMMLEDTKNFLSKHFEMKDFGDASFVLGI
ncbi:unnamed protein product [Rhodiola kirilowii]